MITREKFIEITGEDPVNMFGEEGWEEMMEEYVYGDNEDFHEGHLVGGCFQCKMDQSLFSGEPQIFKASVIVGSMDLLQFGQVRTDNYKEACNIR